MPLVRIDLRRAKPVAYRAALKEGVFRALNDTFEVPEDDRFAVVSEHDAENFEVDRGYLGVERSEDAVIIHITASRTRGVAQKKALFAAIVRNLAAAPGLRPEDICIILADNGREDWSFGNGVAQYIS
jgi:4-oxalocrotonate tautomerase